MKLVLAEVKARDSVNRTPPASRMTRRFQTSPRMNMNGSMKLAINPGTLNSSPIWA
jgi:hypothetical protein